MEASSLWKSCALFGLLSLTAHTNAGLIGIINGSTGTSEPGTTAAITANLDTLLQAVGNTTQIYDLVPADLSSFDQIWDIRFTDSQAITASEETQYLNFLQDGGGIFAMGENDGFVNRNNSVLSLIAAAGGGSLNFITSADTQNVVAPFDGPNLIPDGNVTYEAPGGVTSSGSGQFITVDGSGNGAGVAFGVGDLAFALDGALTTIFDVNFMQAIYDQPDSQNLLKNLISFVEEEVDPTVPEPTTLALMGLGLAGIGYRRHRSKIAA